MININKNIEEDITYWDLVDEITKGQVFDAVNETNSINSDIEILKVLQIDNDSISRISGVDHVKISFFSRNHLKKYSRIKVAFVINKPVNVALSILAMKTLSGGKLFAKVFSDKENAKEWLINMN